MDPDTGRHYGAVKGTQVEQFDLPKKKFLGIYLGVRHNCGGKKNFFEAAI